MSEESHELPPISTSPALFEAALEALPTAAIIGEAEPPFTRVVAANRRWLELLGWPAEELIGMDAVSSGLYVGPILMADLEVTLDAAGELLNYESQTRMKDGGLRRMKNSTRLFEVEGRKYSITTSVPVEDIGELADALHESEARLQEILDAVPFIFALIEPDGRFRMANRRLYEVMGREPEAVLGHHLDEVFTPGSARAMRAYLERMQDGGDVEVQEATFEDDGRQLWFRTSCFPLRRRRGPDAGQPYAACLLAIDVTEERATEQALRESDTRFRQLAGSMDDAFVLWGGDPPKVLYASPSLAKLYGVDHISAIPTDTTNADRTTHPDDEAFRWEMYNKRVHSDEDLDYEYRIIHPDGGVRWIRVRSSRVRVDGQPVDRVATTMSDVTDLKQAELELRAAWATAEEANQRKNDFLSRMSHELRTPLNAILGFTQLLELDDLTADQRSNLAHVGRAGRHLLELINDVLDVSRIESGELRLSVGPVDLGEALLETVAMMRPLMDQSDVTLDLPLDAPSTTVTADRQRLIQVLLNLLTNAVKYNRTGGRASVRWAAQPNGRIRIEVADTGIGMAAADVARLFTPFERFAPDVQGTGIGLALTRQLVEAMGGTIAVQSTPGEGTTFAIDLAGSAANRGGAATADDEGGDRGDRRALVLCVEPHLPDVELLRRTLDLIPGCELAVADSARAALEMAADDPPDLVLVDLSSPDEPGDVLVRQLRTQPGTADIDVIVVSADINPEQRIVLQALGVRRVLIKPYRLSQLLDAVEESLER